METNSEHINNLFKQKFEDFAPQPPEHVWANIASALDKGIAPAWYSTFAAKAAAVLLGIALLLGGYLFLNSSPQPSNGPALKTAYQNNTVTVASIDTKSDKNIEKQHSAETKSIHSGNAGNLNTNSSAAENNNGNLAQPSEPNSNITQSSAMIAALPESFNATGYQASTTKTEKSSHKVNNTTSFETVTGNINLMSKKTITLKNSVPVSMFATEATGHVNQNAAHVHQMGHWVLGFYFSPEYIFSSFDSLTIQNSYALKIEPAYYINNHWFIRPGIGVNYARDKGFAKADYMSWDYLGSYEDVVDVTFDTSGNTITPVYHTQTRDVYDSILHVSVSEETNRYLYLQTSVVFGYHNHVNKFGWSIYAGPQVNFILSEKRDNPVDKDASVIYLKYNLAERKSPQYSFKLGFSIDYAIAKKWLISVEPEYSYFVNGINGGDAYNKPLPGVGLRFGLIYTLK